MKILLVIDHLGLGGAQRQLVDLACGLKVFGHAVEIFNYFPEHNFFRPRVEAQGIVIHDSRKRKGFSIGVLRKLAGLMHHGSFDVAVSYLNNPNLYAVLAKLLGGGCSLIVSERCNHHDDGSALIANARRFLHLFADHVVTNSQTHAQWLDRKWALNGKVSCIYNGADLQSFYRQPPVYPAKQDLRLLAVGRICPQKNVLRLIEALHSFYVKHRYVPRISWAGKREGGASGEAYGREVDETLERYPEIRARWHWLGQQSDMPRLYREHDALIHPALYEGLPNAVCEALAAGMPVLVSNVCDHPLLVADGERGFLFDPYDSRAITNAIEKLMALDESSWLSFSDSARKFAEQNLATDRMICAYEQLLAGLASGRVNRSNVRGDFG